jgi:epoxyqueuosine reductase
VSFTDRIKARALELGFDAVRIAAVTPGDTAVDVRESAAAGTPEADTPATTGALEASATARAIVHTPGADHFEAWIGAGRHGEMAWLATARNRARRADPANILHGIRSILCVALCHEPDTSAARNERLGRIARYAAGEDYHRVMRDLLGTLARFIEETLPGARALWYADTGAILERGWAERAGLGWNAKHSGLTSPTLGSWLLLGEVLVNRELEPDAPFDRERCGSCTRCLETCPTGAIVAPGQVDGRRCISYLTIEHPGPIEPELRPLMGDWIFGCDLCQEVCPWNRFAPAARMPRLHAHQFEDWTLERFLTLDEPGFRELFATSAIRRSGRGRFLRNVCVALGNRGETPAAPALARARDTDHDPIVREHATWALEAIKRGRGPRPTRLERAG